MVPEIVAMLSGASTETAAQMLIFSTSSFADGKNCGAVSAMPDVKNDDERSPPPARTSSNRPDNHSGRLTHHGHHVQRKLYKCGRIRPSAEILGGGKALINVVGCSTCRFRFMGGG